MDTPTASAPTAAREAGIFGLAPESENFLHLDLMRFIASMGIVIIHFAGRLGFSDLQVAGLNFFVDIFFVISGIVITYVYQDRIATASQTGDFLVARAARLLPLHFLMTFAFVALGLLSGLIGVAVNDADKYDFACLPASLFLTHAVVGCDHPVFNFVSWSISAEFVMYLLFPLLIGVFARRRGILLGLAIGFVLLFSLFDWGWWERTYDHGVMRAIPAFMLGMAAWLFRDDLARLPVRSWMFVPLVLALLGAMAVLGESFPALLCSYAVVLVLLAMDLRTEAYSATVRYLAPLGQLTYSTYMIHTLFHAIVLAFIAQRILHLQGLALHAASWLSLPVLIALSYASLIWFETPARKWLRARFSRRVAVTGK
ncbi:acyltransferase family protein [Rhodobacter lacus]|uniref:Acyltransferase family protein n=1 Tax=Rhodobacter lacus TaxID=1641972 RepID=A0ABW5AE73_9RHOB